MRRVCLGGTFDVVHVGHEALLEKAFEVGDHAFIGLTEGAMAKRGRKRVSAYATRKRNLERFLRARGWASHTIDRLTDEAGPAASDPTLEAIVVSAERRGVADRINQARLEAGLMPLLVHVVPMVLAGDDCPVSSTRIKAGDIDRDGRMRRAVTVNIGSSNPVKAAAVREVLRGVYAKAVFAAVAVESGVPAQPMEKDTLVGAMNRARRAIAKADFGVGIEAGLFWNEATSQWLDVQWCAIVDKTGRITLGHGPGFAYPPAVANDIQLGRTVGEAMEKLTGIRGIGEKEGAIGYLTKGKLDRTRLTAMAVTAAAVPRIRKSLYADGVP